MITGTILKQYFSSLNYIDQDKNIILQAIYEKTRERPTHTNYPCGTEFDSITQHESDLTVIM